MRAQNRHKILLYILLESQGGTLQFLNQNLTVTM